MKAKLVSFGHLEIDGVIHARDVVLDGGKRTDVIFIGPAQMETVDMVPDDPGTWMYHCHFDEHMKAGMMALYKVEP